MIGLGFLVAHPDWRGELVGCCNTDLTSLELFHDVQPQTPEPLSPMTKAWLRLNILGRLVIDSIPILPETPIQHAISGGRPGKEETRALLDELPQPVRASAVVEPVTPLGVDEFGELLAVARMLGEGVSNTAPTDFSPRDRPRRVFVGVEREGAPVESFQPPGLR